MDTSSTLMNVSHYVTNKKNYRMTWPDPSTLVKTFTIEVVLNHLDGTDEIYIVDGVTRDTKVVVLRKNVAQHFHIDDGSHLLLLFNNKELYDAKTLGFYKIKMGSVIQAQINN